MKNLIGLLALLISSVTWAQTFPAGIWTGQTTDIPYSVQNVTLTVLPNGQYWGVVDVIWVGGDGSNCPLLVWGNLAKGGLGVTTSQVSMDADLGPSGCVQPSAWGNATLKMSSPTTATWAVNHPLIYLKAFNLTLSTPTAAPASLATISGFWNSPQTGYTEIVTPTGASISYNQILGCIGSGQYTVVDTIHHLFSFTEKVYNCDSAVFNGTRNGMATVSNSALTKQTTTTNSSGIVNVVESSYSAFFYGH